MSTITTKDGVEIFYKDWGKGQPIVFSHGWPLSADDWDTQMMFFLKHGYRVIAHDRRGHGRSTQTGGGHDMDHYADDLAALTAHLDLKDAVHVGHSTGGGEVVHYLARHGESRVAKAVIISAVPPLMVKTAANPGGLPKSVFDGFQAQLAANRAQFFYDVPAGPFYGYNRPGAKPSQGVIWNWWRQGMMGGAKAHYDGIVAFSQTDFTEDLKKITVPVLVMHGDDDQIVPYADSAPLSAKLLKNGTLKTYKGFPHGMPTTEADTINADLLAFLKTRVAPRRLKLRFNRGGSHDARSDAHGTGRKVAGAGGLNIFVRSWRPHGVARAVVVICPGFNAHSGQYQWVGEQFAAIGLAVYALDLRGRGRSDGERFYVEKMADYVSDVATVIALAKTRGNPACPCIYSDTAREESSPAFTRSSISLSSPD